jgi:hypothetical protein
VGEGQSAWALQYARRFVFLIFYFRVAREIITIEVGTDTKSENTIAAIAPLMMTPVGAANDGGIPQFAIAALVVQVNNHPKKAPNRSPITVPLTPTVNAS